MLVLSCSSVSDLSASVCLSVSLFLSFRPFCKFACHSLMLCISQFLNRTLRLTKVFIKTDRNLNED